jgi:hypothetical protein
MLEWACDTSIPTPSLPPLGCAGLFLSFLWSQMSEPPLQHHPQKEMSFPEEKWLFVGVKKYAGI